MTCHEAQLLLGVYVLGAADPGERAQVDAHLAGCPACRNEVTALEGLPAMLGLVPRAEVERIPLSRQEIEAVAPSPGQLERLLQRAASHRTRRRWVSAAAAALIVVAGSGALAVESRQGVARPPAATVTWSAATPDRGTRAEVRLSPRPSGTAMELTLSGVPAGTLCSLVVEAQDGHASTAASWQADYSGQAQVTGSSPTALGQIASLSIVTSSGATLLRLRP